LVPNLIQYHKGVEFSKTDTHNENYKF
jgi:hypothetical protein